MTVVIGTAGHIDHGKTSLLRALTGIDADRLPEEQRRGMTIDVGFAHLRLGDGTELDFVDVPGHDRLVGNMLVGAGEIDVAMLVVAADDGPRAQTLEHLELLDALGIDDGIAVISKADAVAPERVAAVVGETVALLARTRLAGRPVLAASSLTGDGLSALLAELSLLAGRAPAREPGHGGARLAIDRVFTVKGRGTVVTGTLRGETGVSRGDTLRLLPDGRDVRVREVQVHGGTVERATAGRTALNLVAIETRELHRGMVLTSDSTLVATDRILVALSVPAGLDRPRPTMPADRTRARVHMGTAQVGATIGRTDRDSFELTSGEVTAILRLDAAVAAAHGDRFVLRRASPAATLAGGRILDVDPPRGVGRRRMSAQRVEQLAAAVGPAEVDRARIELHGGLGDGRVRLATDVARALRETILGDVVRAPGGRPLADLRAAAAIGLRRMVRLEPGRATDAAAAAIDDLVEAGVLARAGESIHLRGHEPAGPTPELVAAMDRLVALLDVATPPSLAAAASEAGCPEPAIRDLERSGRIVRLGADLAYAATTFSALADRALALANGEPLTPAAFRDAIGASRKYVMALLEELDRRGVLRRTPDGHVPGPKAAATASGPRR